MPSAVDALKVKIASPGDAATELLMTREVICDWNADHALAQRRILLPLHRPAAGEAGPEDLLVAFFCSSELNRDDRSSGATESAIAKQLQEGRPALVYFSEARAHLRTDDGRQDRVLDSYRAEHPAAVVDSYADEKEFRSKFARQLEAALAGVIPTSLQSAAGVSTSPLPLSECAQTILMEACDDFEAYIGRLKVGASLRIQANGKQLVEPNDPATVAKWEAAFQELLGGQYIRDAGCNGQLFQISPKGFAFLQTIGKTPVGYIAELGGM